MTEELQELLFGGDEEAVLAFCRSRKAEWDLYQLGQVCFQFYYFRAAFEAWSELLSGDQTAPLLGVASLCFREAHFDQSARFMRRVVELNPENAEYLCLLASSLERVGELEEAEALLHKALAISPRNARSIRQLAHLERNSKRLDCAQSRLEEAISWGGEDEWRLRYELAAVYDRNGLFEKALATLLSAKAHLVDAATSQIPIWRAVTQRQWECTQQLTDERLAKWAAGSSGCDLVLMAGFPRSGTSLLEKMLSSHERCIGTDESGILMNQFTQSLVHEAVSSQEAMGELDSFIDEELAGGRQEYLRCTEAVLGEPVNGRILIEKDPLLTIDLPVPLRLFPDCKILMPIRDPRDVVISFFFTMVPTTPNSVAAISLEKSCQYYAEVMRHWLLLKERLPQERWLESRYEDLLDDPEGQTRRLADFLSIEWSPSMVDHQKRGGDQTISTPTYHDVSQPLYRRSEGRWRQYEQALAPHLHLLEPYLKAFGYE